MSSPGPLMRPYERMVRIQIRGREFEVPDSNMVLRCLQFLAPEDISYGRFCWNEDCQYCRVTYDLGKGTFGAQSDLLQTDGAGRYVESWIWPTNELLPKKSETISEIGGRVLPRQTAEVGSITQRKSRRNYGREAEGFVDAVAPSLRRRSRACCASMLRG